VAEITQRQNKLCSPFGSAETFWIEEIVDPRETQPLLCEFVELAELAAPLRRPGPYVQQPALAADTQDADGTKKIRHRRADVRVHTTTAQCPADDAVDVTMWTAIAGALLECRRSLCYKALPRWRESCSTRGRQC
jgi:hypothetical protein